MLCFFTANRAGIAEVFLLEGNAARGHASLLLHFQLAVKLAAPHGLDEAALFLLKLLCFLEGMRFENVLVEVLLGLVEKTPLHGVEQLGDL